MGKRGPPRTPTEILKARGSKKAKGRAPSVGPTPERKAPKRPAWLTPEAVEVWDHTVPILQQMGILTVADGPTIARYCQSYVDWVASDAEIRKEGAWYQMPNGMKRPHPAVRMRTEYARVLKECEDRLGLTPSARSSLNVTVAWMPGAKPAPAAPPPLPAPAKGDAPAPIDGERFFGKRAE
jgi:P27 family predicted phage terminase small subunit